jgi:hypothetical protein
VHLGLVDRRVNPEPSSKAVIPDIDSNATSAEDGGK